MKKGVHETQNGSQRMGFHTEEPHPMLATWPGAADSVPLRLGSCQMLSVSWKRLPSGRGLTAVPTVAEEPGRLPCMGSLRVGHDWATSLSLFTFTFHFHSLEKEMATHSSVLAWRISGTGEPGGLPSYGVAQSRTQLKRLSSSSTGEEDPRIL